MNYNSDRTRARILDAALAEFREHGYERAGLRRIAAAARVTTGAVYNHFGSKEGLFDALVGESAAELVDAWTAGRDDGAPAPRTTGAVAATAVPADPGRRAAAGDGPSGPGAAPAAPGRRTGATRTAHRAALEHRLTRSEAQRYMERIARFRLAGWAGLLGPTTAPERAPETGERS